MKIVAITSALALLTTFTPAMAAPVTTQAGVTSNSSLVQAKFKKKRIAKKDMKGIKNMKGMDHGKMTM